MLPISEVSTLVMTYPFIIGILGYFFLREKYKMIDFKCLVASFFGIILVAKPEFIFDRLYPIPHDEKVYEQRIIGIILSILVAVFTALESMILRKLKSVSNACTHVLYFSFGTVLVAPFSSLQGDLLVGYEMSPRIFLVMVGVFLCGLGGQFLNSKAYSLEKANLISILAMI